MTSVLSYVLTNISFFFLFNSTIHIVYFFNLIISIINSVGELLITYKLITDKLITDKLSK